MSDELTKLSFVPAIEDDRGFFIHVHHVSYRSVIEKMFGWEENLQDNYANKAFDAGGMHIIWSNNQRIGVVGWEDRVDFIWLKELFLLPDFQGKGIGSRIVKATIKKAEEQNKSIRLQTLKANIGAKKLYEKHGFVVTDLTDIHWQMALPLTSMDS